MLYREDDILKSNFGSKKIVQKSKSRRTAMRSANSLPLVIVDTIGNDNKNEVYFCFSELISFTISHQVNYPTMVKSYRKELLY